MARGGFRRMLKHVDGVVVDHRPLGHVDAKTGDWIDAYVPGGIPATLNELIRSRTIIVSGKAAKFPSTYEKPAPVYEPTGLAILIEALDGLKLIADEELEAARKRLIERNAAEHAE